MKKLHLLVAGAIVCAAVSITSTASADTIATIEGDASGTAVSLTSSAVVTSILSQPGTFGGHTYTGWSFLVNDGTGSLDIFASATALTTLGYTPTVGDAINIAGTYSPFHQIPELASPTSLTLLSSGNAVPAPIVSTIPQLNVPTLPFSIAGQLLELDNVTIQGASGNFPNASTSYTIADSSANSMTMFYWYTSYSTDGTMYNTPIPTGPVKMIGFDSVFPTGNVAEFTPIEIIIVPEPATVCLIGLGAAALCLARKRPA